MRNADIGYYTDVGTRAFCHSFDFAEMIHTHFNNRRLGIVFKAKQGFGHSDFIIEITLGLYRFKLLGKHGVGHFFCRRFADRTGKAYYRQIIKRTAVIPRKVKQSLAGILNCDYGYTAVNLFTDKHRRSSVLSRLRHKVVPVKFFSLKTYEKAPLWYVAAVGRNRCHNTIIAREPAAYGFCNTRKS
ncbi:unknown [Eubacterium sp. CAG:180]|nr:unknown [Eubacterium sp. CAG:180]